VLTDPAGSEDELLRIAAGVERSSEHPLARAVVEAATARGLTLPDVSDFDSPVGRGVLGTVENHQVTLGSADFLTSQGIDPTAAALADLRAQGVQVVMLTGDNQVTAQAVATSLGIDRVEAGVLPDRKADVVQRLRTEGRVVAMAGDRVNDAPPSPQPMWAWR
jgi:P-type Cu+ transporter